MFTGADQEKTRLTLERADCFDFLARQSNASIDAVITDPPYGTMNAEWDRGPVDLTAWWTAVRRVLKPNGVVLMFAADRFLFRAQASNPKWYRYDLIWHKTRPVGFLNANHRPLRAHEYVLFFGPHPKSSTYNPQKTQSGKPPRTSTGNGKKSTLYRGHGRLVTTCDGGTRHPNSVLLFPSILRRERMHPTQKPLDLLRWLVRTYTNAGDVVCDTFLGSGTTAEATLIEGRRFVGCERDDTFYNRASARVARYACDTTPRLAA